MARESWSLVFALFGISQIMPKMVVPMLACWHGKFPNNSGLRVRKAAPFCILWTIGQERNRRTFNGVECPIFVLNFSSLSNYYYYLCLSELLHLINSWNASYFIRSDLSLKNMEM